MLAQIESDRFQVGIAQPNWMATIKTLEHRHLLKSCMVTKAAWCLTANIFDSLGPRFRVLSGVVGDVGRENVLGQLHRDLGTNYSYLSVNPSVFVTILRLPGL